MSGNMDQNEFSYSYSTAVVTYFQYFNADVVNAQSGEGYPLKKSSRTTFNVVLRVTYCLFTSCWLARNQLSRNLLSFSCNPSGQLCLSGPGYSSRIVNIFLSVFFFFTYAVNRQTSVSPNWYPHRNAPPLTGTLRAKPGDISREARDADTECQVILVSRFARKASSTSPWVIKRLPWGSKNSPLK